ncbi:MAG: hypothetical protein HQK51_16850 [Oligoflexia bacterium]|nr:hypothetical protein [Oligoflexia bacterium]
MFLICLFLSSCSQTPAIPAISLDRLNHPYMNFNNDLAITRSSFLTGLNSFAGNKGSGSACTSCAK